MSVLKNMFKVELHRKSPVFMDICINICTRGNSEIVLLSFLHEMCIGVNCIYINLIIFMKLYMFM